MKIKRYEFFLMAGTILIITSFIGMILEFLHRYLYGAWRPVYFPATLYQSFIDTFWNHLHIVSIFWSGVGVGMVIMLFCIKKVVDSMMNR